MQTLKTSKAELLFVVLPKEYDKYTIQRFSMSGDWIIELNSKGLNHWKVNIPRGYTLIGKLSTIPEDVAKGLVDEINNIFTRNHVRMYRDYADDIIKATYHQKAIPSLTSIATHLGMDINENIYLLKKI